MRDTRSQNWLHQLDRWMYRRAPLAEFDRIAARYPVFRITADPSSSR